MKRIVPALIAALAAASVPAVRAQTVFADYSAMPDGAASYSAPWSTLGSIHHEVTWFANSNGVTTGGVQTPTYLADIQSDLKLFAPALPGIGISTGRINPVNTDLGYNLTFTFHDLTGTAADFPGSLVFYVGDQDAGEIVVSASRGGQALDTSDWFLYSAQTAGSGSGAAPVWDAASHKLVAGGASTNFVNEFRPDEAFDTLTFTYQNGGRGDNISYSVGNVAVVPEPGGALLLGVSGLLVLMCRRRSCRA